MGASLLNLTDKQDLRPLAALIRDLQTAKPDADVMLVGAIATIWGRARIFRKVPAQPAATDIFFRKAAPLLAFIAFNGSKLGSFAICK